MSAKGQKFLHWKKKPAPGFGDKRHTPHVTVASHKWIERASCGGGDLPIGTPLTDRRWQRSRRFFGLPGPQPTEQPAFAFSWLCGSLALLALVHLYPELQRKHERARSLTRNILMAPAPTNLITIGWDAQRCAAKALDQSRFLRRYLPSPGYDFG